MKRSILTLLLAATCTAAGEDLPSNANVIVADYERKRALAIESLSMPAIEKLKAARALALRDGRTADAEAILCAIGRITQDVAAARPGPNTDEALAAALCEGAWVYTFDPPKSKDISFLSSGAIDRGSNKNEHTWAVSDGVLNIRTKFGRLSRAFRYDASKKAWVGDPDRKGIHRVLKGIAIRQKR